MFKAQRFSFFLELSYVKMLWILWDTFVVDGVPLSFRGIRPDAVRKHMSRYVRQRRRKKWSTEHNVEELIEDVWFDPVKTIIQTKTQQYGSRSMQTCAVVRCQWCCYARKTIRLRMDQRLGECCRPGTCVPCFASVSVLRIVRDVSCVRSCTREVRFRCGVCRIAAPAAPPAPRCSHGVPQSGRSVPWKRSMCHFSCTKSVIFFSLRFRVAALASGFHHRLVFVGTEVRSSACMSALGCIRNDLAREVRNYDQTAKKNERVCEVAVGTWHLLSPMNAKGGQRRSGVASSRCRIIGVLEIPMRQGCRVSIKDRSRSMFRKEESRGSLLAGGSVGCRWWRHSVVWNGMHLCGGSLFC